MTTIKNHERDEEDNAVLAADVPATVDDFLCFALYSASLAMTKLYQSRLRPLGLTYPQYLVLLTLQEHNNITVSEIGDRVFLDSGTLSHLLKRLESGGIIARNRDVGGDERRVIISLTKQGWQLTEQAYGVPTDMVSVMGTPYEELAGLACCSSTRRQKLIAARP